MEIFNINAARLKKILNKIFGMYFLQYVFIYSLFGITSERFLHAVSNLALHAFNYLKSGGCQADIISPQQPSMFSINDLQVRSVARRHHAAIAIHAYIVTCARGKVITC